MIHPYWRHNSLGGGAPGRTPVKFYTSYLYVVRTIYRVQAWRETENDDFCRLGLLSSCQGETKMSETKATVAITNKKETNCRSPHPPPPPHHPICQKLFSAKILSDYLSIGLLFFKIYISIERGFLSSRSVCKPQTSNQRRSWFTLWVFLSLWEKKG